MPVPLIIIAIASILTVAAAGGLYLKWDTIQLLWSGKTIAILGERQVGKTTLINFLKSGELPDKYEATLGINTYTGRHFKLSDLGIKFSTPVHVEIDKQFYKGSKDVSGGPNAYFQWESVVKEADYIFYLIRSDNLLSDREETKDRIEDDIRQILTWIKVNPKSKSQRLAIVGTYADKDQRFLSANEDDVAAMHDAFAAHPLVMKLARDGGNNVLVVIGSLLTTQYAQRLVFKIFHGMETHK